MNCATFDAAVSPSLMNQTSAGVTHERLHEFKELLNEIRFSLCGRTKGQIGKRRCNNSTLGGLFDRRQELELAVVRKGVRQSSGLELRTSSDSL